MSFGSQRKLILCMVLVAGLCFSCATKALADSGPQPSLRLDMSKKYPASGPPGADTPIFHHTKQGQLVMIRGHLDGTSNSLLSDDRGRTWHKWDAYRAWPKMGYADVVRRGNELLAFGHNTSSGYTGTYLWRSNDEGQTWSGGLRLTPDKDPYAPMNQRVLLMSRGRLIVPVEQLLGVEGPGPNRIGTVYSDDAGRSWKRSPIFGPPPPLPDRPEGFGEPAVVELNDGKLWMVFRTRFGHLWQAWSSDGGATWGKPSATQLISPLSAVSAKRIPDTDAVIVIWNNAKPGTSAGFVATGSLYTPRSPLVFAVSRDNCQTWSQPVVIDRGTAAYPSICFLEKEMFVCYWADPDPNQVVWCNPNSHLILVAYDLPSLLRFDPRGILRSKLV